MSRRWGDEPVPLSESLSSVVAALRNEQSTASTATGGASAGALGGVFGRWEEAVGAAVAAHVQPVKLDGTRLVVEVDDPAWATQLRFLEGTLKTRLHDVVGVTIERIDVRVARA